MFELLFCALFTIFPNYLVKRYIYKQRWGKELTFFTIWYELRWGITACALMTVSLIALIFYYHPSTTNVSTFFRTVTILPESAGRVEKVYIESDQWVKKGEPLFSLESSSQQAAVKAARSTLAEVQAMYSDAVGGLGKAEGQVQVSRARLAQTESDYKRYQILASSGVDLISKQSFEQAKNNVETSLGRLNSNISIRDQMVARVEKILPAKEKHAEDVLEQAIVEFEKTTIYARTSGQIVQLMLRPGDIVNPLLRPAGLLIPSDVVTSQAVQAGFSQLAAPVIKPGVVAEVVCFSKPFTIIPMVVTDVQSSIANGQMRPTDQIIDIQDRNKPGTLTVRLEALYNNGLEGVVPGSKCIANAYTNNHDLIASGELSTSEWIYYHVVDTVGIVQALLLRVQALFIPLQNLVFSGH